MSNSTKSESFKRNGNDAAHGTPAAETSGSSRVKAADVFADMAKVRQEHAIPLIETAELLTTVQVRKPKSSEFFRTHPDDEMSMIATIYEHPDTHEVFYVLPHVRDALDGQARQATLVLCINQSGVVFLWPIKEMTGGGGSHTWSDSAKRAANHARTKWLRVIGEMKNQKYRVHVALGDLPDPQWPEHSFKDYLILAFDNRIIKSEEHSAVRELKYGRPQ